MKSAGGRIVLQLLKRILLQIPVLLGVTFLTFLLLWLAPGDPVRILAESKGRPVSSEIMEEQRRELGLDRPFPVQYADWLTDVLRGDFGKSMVTGKAVKEEMGRYLPATLLLTVLTMGMTALISIPLGIYSATKKGSTADKVIRFLSSLAVSVPSFLLGLAALYVFALRLGLVPVQARGLSGVIMPTAVMTVGMSGWYIRQVRTIILEQMQSAYVLGMRSRGVHERTILYRHVLRNALAPILTLMGMSFGGMLGGTAIVENIFSWQGAGYWAVNAISRRDYPVILAYVLWMAVIYIVVNYAVDVLCTLIDPRRRERPGRR